MTKINRDSAIGLLKALSELPKDLKYSKHLLFSISKTRATIAELLKDLQAKETAVNDDSFKTLQKERTALVESFATKDENGQFVADGKNYTFTEENTVAVQEALVKFNADNKETIDKMVAVSQELNDYLLEEIEFEVTTTSIENLPDSLDIETYNLLSLFIKE